MVDSKGLSMKPDPAIAPLEQNVDLEYIMERASGKNNEPKLQEQDWPTAVPGKLKPEVELRVWGIQGLGLIWRVLCVVVTYLRI